MSTTAARVGGPRRAGRRPEYAIHRIAWKGRSPKFVCESRRGYSLSVPKMSILFLLSIERQHNIL